MDLTVEKIDDICRLTQTLNCSEQVSFVKMAQMPFLAWG